jgi:hypothetical protein
MGGDLRAAPKGKRPTFLVGALKDVIGGHLDRIQIVKGWLDAKGALHERVYDAALGWRSQAGSRDRQAAAGGQHGGRGECHLDQHHRSARTGRLLDGRGLRFQPARLLLRESHRDSHAALDGVRRKALRREDCRGGAHDDSGEGFADEARISFTHVYLSPERRRDGLARDAARLLARLREGKMGVDVGALGDPFLLPYGFDAVPADEIARLFGASFAAKLGELPTGEWQGPLESGYGAHLVLVIQRTQAREPDFGAVREAVRREWASARRIEANARLYQTLLQRYTVRIEQAELAAAADGLAQVVR